MSEIPQAVRTAILKQQERIFLLHLEKDLVAFITKKHKSKKEAQHIIQAMYLKNSYYRLLSHQLCQYYNLQHWNNTSNEIIVTFVEEFDYETFIEQLDGDNELYMRLSEYIQVLPTAVEPKTVSSIPMKPKMLMKKLSKGSKLNGETKPETEEIINFKLENLSIEGLDNMESQRANKEALYMKIREQIFDQQTKEDNDDEEEEDEDEERSSSESGGENGSADTSESSIDDFYRNQHHNHSSQNHNQAFNGAFAFPPVPPPPPGYNYPMDHPNVYNNSIPMGFPSPALQYPYGVNYSPHYPPMPQFQGPPIPPSPSQQQQPTTPGTAEMMSPVPPPVGPPGAMPPPVMIPYIVSPTASFPPMGMAPAMVSPHGRYKNYHYNNSNNNRNYSYDKEMERKILNNPYIILPDNTNNGKYKKPHHKRYNNNQGRYNNHNYYGTNNNYNQTSPDYSASSTK